MRKTEYKRLREEIGERGEVSQLLGVDDRTIQRRESGVYTITKEAAWAIRGVVASLRNGSLKPQSNKGRTKQTPNKGA